jgi:hypothetical protein
VADMEIAVWFRWKTRHDSAAMFAGFMIDSHDVSDKV